MIFDGVSFFRDFSIPYFTGSKNASTGWYSLRCPFHSDSSDHMGFNPQSGALTCWVCGKKSSLEYVKTVLGVSKGEASAILGRYLKRFNRSDIITEHKQATGVSVELPGKDFTDYERRYLGRRGFTEDMIEHHDVRSGGLSGDWAYRVVFPIVYNGVIVSATGRGISRDVEPRYWTLPMSKEIIHHKHIFYGIDEADDTVIVVEGPIDAMKGGAPFVASFGVNLTDEQICLLLKYKKVIFLKDNDEAGDKFIEQAYKLSSLGGEDIEVASLPKSWKDVGDMPIDEIAYLREELGV